MKKNVPQRGASISAELLEEFRGLYKEEFGEQLSEEETLERALDVLELFRAIYRPIPVHKSEIYRSFRGCYKEDTESDV